MAASPGRRRGHCVRRQPRAGGRGQRGVGSAQGHAVAGAGTALVVVVVVADAVADADTIVMPELRSEGASVEHIHTRTHAPTRWKHASRRLRRGVVALVRSKAARDRGCAHTRAFARHSAGGQAHTGCSGCSGCSGCRG
jgi:hypothetical protein